MRDWRDVRCHECGQPPQEVWDEMQAVVEAARAFAGAVGWVTDEELIIKAFELRGAVAALDGER